MLLHWGAEYLEKVLPPHLQARIKELRCDPTLDTSKGIAPVPYVDALSGKVLASIPLAGGNRVSRMKIRRFLTRGENLNIQFGKTAEKMNVEGDSVSVSFHDGSTATGSMIVGADGSRSKVREFLVGSEAAKPQFVDLTMINYPLGGYTAEEARLLQTLHPVFKIAAHPQNPGNGILGGTERMNVLFLNCG